MTSGTLEAKKPSSTTKKTGSKTAKPKRAATASSKKTISTSPRGAKPDVGATPAVTLSSIVIQLKEKHGGVRDKFAKDSGIARTSLLEIEKGRTLMPEDYTLQKLAKSCEFHKIISPKTGKPYQWMELKQIASEEVRARELQEKRQQELLKLGEAAAQNQGVTNDALLLRQQELEEKARQLEEQTTNYLHWEETLLSKQGMLDAREQKLDDKQAALEQWQQDLKEANAELERVRQELENAPGIDEAAEDYLKTKEQVERRERAVAAREEAIKTRIEKQNQYVREMTRMCDAKIASVRFEIEQQLRTEYLDKFNCLAAQRLELGKMVELATLLQPTIDSIIRMA